MLTLLKSLFSKKRKTNLHISSEPDRENTPQFSEFGGIELKRQKPVPPAEWYEFNKKVWLYALIIGLIFVLVWGGVFFILQKNSISLFHLNSPAH